MAKASGRMRYGFLTVQLVAEPKGWRRNKRAYAEGVPFGIHSLNGLQIRNDDIGPVALETIKFAGFDGTIQAYDSCSHVMIAPGIQVIGNAPQSNGQILHIYGVFGI